MNRSGWICLLVAGLLAFGVSTVCQATLVTGWGSETGFTNGTVTDNGGGSATASNPTGNLGVRAILSSAISLPNVGDGVSLTGTFVSSKVAATSFGNQQFRFGLFNTNGHAQGTLGSGTWSGADPSGWFGYIVQVGQDSGTTSLFGRNGSGSNAWLSTTGAGYQVDNSNSPTSDPLPGTYALGLSMYRISATALSISYSFIQTVGGSFTTTGTFSDNGGLSAAVGATSYKAVGIFLNVNTGGGTFTNMDVSTFTVVVPEASAFACCAIAAVIGRILTPRRSRV